MDFYNQASQKFNGFKVCNDHFIGESPSFLNVLANCASVAPYPSTVLLTGDTGTGKGVCARLIHSNSPWAAGPFIAVDCASIPESLFAHELFGHDRGAFTDAREARRGLISAAAHGTLFLDEVESLSIGTQGALLRLLEDQSWRPLGSLEVQKVNCRIIAATNQDLFQYVQDKLFRSDLYYRLCVSVISLPPLRERPEDIPLLTSYFLEEFSQTYQKGRLTLSDEAIEALCSYEFQGNVRELKNMIQEAVIRATGHFVGLKDLRFQHKSNNTHSHRWKESRRTAIEMWEKAYISHLLTTKSRNISKVASHLGITRQAVYRLVKRYRLYRTTS